MPAVVSSLRRVSDCGLSYVPAPGEALGAPGATVSLTTVSVEPVTVPPGTVYEPATVSAPSASAASCAAGTAAVHEPPATTTLPAGTSTVLVPSVIESETPVASGWAAPLKTTSGAPAATSLAL